MYPVRRGKRNGLDLWTIMLLADLFDRISRMEHKPPVTLVIVAANFLLFYVPTVLISCGLYYVSEFCLLPAAILSRPFTTETLTRIFLSAFTHADAMHLYYNMSSFLYKGYPLEQRFGSERFAKLVVFVTVGAGVMYVLATALFPDALGTLHGCCVGFSGVVFALKTILNAYSDGVDYMYGFTVPTKYAAWAELLLIHVMVPHTSFLGHLCGILVGMGALPLLRKGVL